MRSRDLVGLCVGDSRPGVQVAHWYKHARSSVQTSPQLSTNLPTPQYRHARSPVRTSRSSVLIYPHLSTNMPSAQYEHHRSSVLLYPKPSTTQNMPTAQYEYAHSTDIPIAQYWHTHISQRLHVSTGAIALLIPVLIAPYVHISTGMAIALRVGA
eukprot:3941730-Rhodomonas_salina.1